VYLQCLCRTCHVQCVWSKLATLEHCLLLFRLPLDPASKELLELFEKLRQSVVRVLETMACRAKLTGEMQSAQAQLVAQGVSGVTSKGMMTGHVELVSCKPAPLTKHH